MAANVPIIGGHHVPALQSSPEGWQATPLLERCREHADRRRARGAAARAVPGRDQRHAGIGVAAVDRGARGRRRATADAVSVSGRPLRGAPGGRRDRPRQAVAAAVAPATAMGRVLVGTAAVAELQLDQFWSKRLGVSRKGTRWDQGLFVLVAYRLLAPGSEWRLHREWFQRSALADLLGEDAGLAEIHKLYRCHDRLLVHKQAVFDHLVGRWRDLFNIGYDVLLYDLTSTYFEADPPFPEGDKRRFGYSRDHRPDCVQIVIALVVTPEGLPLAYEVLPGNTSDKTTLRGFLERIERQYGKARRIWLMDRGVPTEEVLTEMRAADPPMHYLVGTPKGRLTRLEKHLVAKPWQEARPGVQVKLLAQEGELYVLAQSRDRVAKERAMRRRQLKRLWARLKQLSTIPLTREELLMKLGAARDQSRMTWRPAAIEVAADAATFSYRLARGKPRP